MTCSCPPHICEAEQSGQPESCRKYEAAQLIIHNPLGVLSEQKGVSAEGRLISAILGAYNTCRPADVSASDHVLAQQTVREALATYSRTAGCEAQGWKDTAMALWALLDDIDTLDDSMKENDEGFRKKTYEIQQLRHLLLSGKDFEPLHDKARKTLRSLVRPHRDPPPLVGNPLCEKCLTRHPGTFDCGANALTELVRQLEQKDSPPQRTQRHVRLQTVTVIDLCERGGDLRYTGGVVQGVNGIEYVHECDCCGTMITRPLRSGRIETIPEEDVVDGK